jgi:hypothetical protein
MTPEQAAAFVISQSACALAEIAAMQARNARYTGTDKYHEPKDFESVIDRYGIGHNAVLQIFQDAR